MNGKGGSSTGGAIIFITDGKHDCKHGGLDIDDKEVLDLIKNTKARIITVAFGWELLHSWFYNLLKPESPDRKESDERLEMLAEISGGKTFFVKDGMKSFVNQKSKFCHLFDFL